MLIVYNLASPEIVQFDKETLPIYGVAYCYCMANNKISWFFNTDKNQVYNALPIVKGKHSISCGDYAALTKESR